MKSIFETNPEISAHEAYTALQGMEGDIPSIDDVRQWLRNHKANLQRRAKKQNLVDHPDKESNPEQGGSSTDEASPEDAAMWNLVNSLFAHEHDTS
jgi:hypothetical protein